MANDGFHDEILWWLHFKRRQGKLPHQLKQSFYQITATFRKQPIPINSTKCQIFLNLKLKLFGILETSDNIFVIKPSALKVAASTFKLGFADTSANKQKLERPRIFILGQINF